MKFLIPLLLAALWLPGCDSNQAQTNSLELVVPKHYTVLKSPSPLTINGKADETSWNLAEWTDFFIDIEGDTNEPPFYNTRVKMLWDEKYIYFYAEMEEEHVWGDITDRDAVIFYNNDFEIFIRPNQFQPYYAEFEVNALGTLWDLFLARPYRRNGPVLDHWDLNETKVGIDVDGTLNDPSDIDERWSVEMAIPIKPINAIDRGVQFGAGNMWRINFSRVQWQHQIVNGNYEKKTDKDGNRHPENNWVWTQQSAIDMHRPEHWGYLYFAENPEEEIQKDELVNEYQLLFHLYRNQLDWKNTTGSFTDEIADFGGPHFSVNQQSMTASVQVTRLGFELTVTNSERTSLTINQDGYIIKSP
ncbi:carbohydrate-binding family 9-like protein [Gracilimonas sp.]|uniref:carbohydrate-binding family 9-like protein n=1 Tax=Gracilimonas sp. TaxID=1974203 RepID=UPI003BA8D807